MCVFEVRTISSFHFELIKQQWTVDTATVVHGEEKKEKNNSSLL